MIKDLLTPVHENDIVVDPFTFIPEMGRFVIER